MIPEFAGKSAEELQFEDVYHQSSTPYPHHTDTAVSVRKCPEYYSRFTQLTIKQRNDGKQAHAIENTLNGPISSISFNPAHNLIGITSTNNKLQCIKYNHDSNMISDSPTIFANAHDAPVLCSCWDNKGQHLWTASCDGKIKISSIENKTCSDDLGMHQTSISCMEYANKYNSLLSGSQDGILKAWDYRSRTNAAALDIGEQIISMSQKLNTLTIAGSTGTIQVFDLRKMTEMTKFSLKHRF